MLVSVIGREFQSHLRQMMNSFSFAASYLYLVEKLEILPRPVVVRSCLGEDIAVQIRRHRAGLDLQGSEGGLLAL